MNRILYISLLLILSCKKNSDLDIEGRNGKTFHNDTTEIIIRDYKNSETLIVDAIQLKNENKPLKAIEKLNQAEKKYGNRLSIYLNRGFCYDMLGKTKEALKDYNKCLEIKSDYYPALQNRGLIYKEMGEFANAINDLSTAIELNPTEPSGYLNRAYLFHSMSQNAESCADASRAIELGFNEKYNSNKANEFIEEFCR